MHSLKKFLFLVSSVTLSAPLISVVPSCSKVSKGKSDLSVSLKYDGKPIAVGKSYNLNIDNFSQLKKAGFTHNQTISFDKNDIVKLNGDSNKISDTISLMGLKQGTANLKVTFTDIATQKIASGQVLITVIDYSANHVKYEDSIGDNEKNPLKFKTDSKGVENPDLEIGHIDSDFWKKIDNKKVKIDINDCDPTKDDNDRISNFIDVKIDDNGKIIAHHKQSIYNYNGQFNVKVSYIDESYNLNDKGHDFWYKEQHKPTELKLTIAPEQPAIDYDWFDSHPEPNKNKLQIKFHVDNNDDWDIIKKADVVSGVKGDINKQLSLISKNITINSSLKHDTIEGVDFENIPSVDDDVDHSFTLDISLKNRSFSSFKVNVPFMFKLHSSASGDSDAIGVNSNFSVSSYRRGIIEIDRSDDKTNNQVSTDTFADNEFDFNNDAGLDKISKDGGLLKDFSFTISKSYSTSGWIDKLKASNYIYQNTIALTKNSFDSIGQLNPGKEENEDKLNLWNQKIKKLSEGKDEVDYANSSKIRLTASIDNNNNLQAKCLGIKGDSGKTTHLNAGEYYFVSKFLDNNNNYEILWTDFKWKAVDISNGNDDFDIQFNNSIMSMPISTDQHAGPDEQVDQEQAAISSGDITNGVTSLTTNNSTISPLMLAYNDIELSSPKADGNFKDSENPYRGYIELTTNKLGLKDEIDDISLSVDSDKQGVVKNIQEKPIKTADGKICVGLTLKGQGNNDLKQGYFKLTATNKLSQKSVSEIIYYAAYAGADSSAGKIDISDFLATPDENISREKTSIFISKSASNREIYLGIANGSYGDASVQNVYVDDGYKYDSGMGPISTDLAPNNRTDNESLKRIKNITFGGDLNVSGSYVIMYSYLSGLSGTLTFCGNVNFTSTSNYSGSGSDLDLAFSTSAIIEVANIKRSHSYNSTVFSGYGIRFAKDVKVNANNSRDLNRENEKLGVIGYTDIVDSQNITFNGDVTVDEGNTKIKEVGVYVYEDLLFDKDSPVSSQTISNQWFEKNLTIGNGNNIGTCYRGIIVENATSKFNTYSEDVDFATINIAGDCKIATTNAVDIKGDQVSGQASVLIACSTANNRSAIKTGHLLNINISGTYSNLISSQEAKILEVCGHYAADRPFKINYNGKTFANTDFKSPTSFANHPIFYTPEYF